MKSDSRSERTSRRLRIIARIWSVPLIVAALFVTAGYTWSFLTTGTADPHAAEDVRFVETLPPILLGLSIMGLGIAWFRERAGALLTLVLEAVLLILLLFQHPVTSLEMSSLIPYLLALAVIIPSLLFLVCSGQPEPTSKHS